MQDVGEKDTHRCLSKGPGNEQETIAKKRLKEMYICPFQKRTLLEEVEDNSVLRAACLMFAGIDLDVIDRLGRAPLHIAVMKQNVYIVQMLLSKCADVNAQCFDGKTSLYLAVECYGGAGGPDRSSEFIIRKLLKSKADPNIQDRKMRTPLHVAIKAYGRRAASGAKQKEDDIVITMLLEGGANPNILDINKKSALCQVAHQFSVQRDDDHLKDIARRLIEKGADVAYTMDWIIRTMGDVWAKRVLRTLIDAGADFRGLGSKGVRLLFLAREGCSMDTFKQLRRSGVCLNPSMHNEDGETLLHVAAKLGNADVATELLEAGADVEAQSGQGNTPLHWAAWRGHCKMIDILFHYGAEVNAKNSSGETPLHLAKAKLSMRPGKQENGQEVVNLLLKYGAEENVCEDARRV